MPVTLKTLTANGLADKGPDVPSYCQMETINKQVMYMALKRELLHARAGTANTKTRAEVRGGGRKPWKQKGTGRARVGSIRSPLWVGGGVIFGPKPRQYRLKLNKKVRALAFKSALSARRECIFHTPDFAFLQQPKTAVLASFLRQNGFDGRKPVLILCDYKREENQHLYLSARNLPWVTLSLPGNLSVHALLKHEAIILTNSALASLEERFAS